MFCRSVILLLILLVLPWSAPAAGEERDAALTEAELKRKTLLLNASVAAGILAWGAANWDYFQTAPNTGNEEWFGHNTPEGGADKIGHVYVTYLVGRAFRQVYLDWGYTEEKAGRLGILSSLGAVTLMEIGDSFSGQYGFSYEDMLMNLAGAGFGYLMETHPELDRKLDLRMEYLPEFDSDFQADFFTDYEHHKYLLALKADGFEAVTHPWLKYLELHLGYYARNYADHVAGGPDHRERTLYVGVGLNVGKLLERWVKVPVFDYLQAPYTYLPLEKTWD